MHYSQKRNFLVFGKRNFIKFLHSCVLLFLHKQHVVTGLDLLEPFQQLISLCCGFAFHLVWVTLLHQCVVCGFDRVVVGVFVKT